MDLVETVLRCFFESGRYTTFARNLNMYSIHRVHVPGDAYVEYKHARSLMLRSEPDAFLQIPRDNVPGKGKKVKCQLPAGAKRAYFSMKKLLSQHGVTAAGGLASVADRASKLTVAELTTSAPSSCFGLPPARTADSIAPAAANRKRMRIADTCCTGFSTRFTSAAAADIVTLDAAGIDDPRNPRRAPAVHDVHVSAVTALALSAAAPALCDSNPCDPPTRVACTSGSSSDCGAPCPPTLAWNALTEMVVTAQSPPSSGTCAGPVPPLQQHFQDIMMSDVPEQDQRMNLGWVLCPALLPFAPVAEDSEEEAAAHTTAFARSTMSASTLQTTPVCEASELEVPPPPPGCVMGAITEQLFPTDAPPPPTLPESSPSIRRIIRDTLSQLFIQ